MEERVVHLLGTDVVCDENTRETARGAASGVARVTRRERRGGVAWCAGTTVHLASVYNTAYRPLASPAALIRRRRARLPRTIAKMWETFNNSSCIILADEETIDVHVIHFHQDLRTFYKLHRPLSVTQLDSIYS